MPFQIDQWVAEEVHNRGRDRGGRNWRPLTYFTKARESTRHQHCTGVNCSAARRRLLKTFKQVKDRHPYHCHPRFELVEKGHHDDTGFERLRQWVVVRLEPLH